MAEQFAGGTVTSDTSVFNPAGPKQFQELLTNVSTAVTGIGSVFTKIVSTLQPALTKLSNSLDQQLNQQPGGTAGGPPSSTFGGQNGGFSGRLALGTAIAGGAALLRGGGSLAQQGMSWSQLEALNAPGIAGGVGPQALAKTGTYSKQFTGWGGDISDLSNAMQSLQGGFVGPVGSPQYTNALKNAGIVSAFGQTRGLSTTMTGAASSLQNIVGTRQGRAFMSSVGLPGADPNASLTQIAGSTLATMEKRNNIKPGSLNSQQLASSPGLQSTMNTLQQYGQMDPQTTAALKQLLITDPSLAANPNQPVTAQGLGIQNNPVYKSLSASQTTASAGQTASLSAANTQASIQTAAANTMKTAADDLSQGVQKFLGALLGSGSSITKGLGAETANSGGYVPPSESAATDPTDNSDPNTSGSSFSDNGDSFASAQDAVNTSVTPDTSGINDNGGGPTTSAGSSTQYGGGVAQSNGGASTGGSDPAAKALSYAQSKLGDPYVFGASGPSTFDCSGLVMAAYQSAGISLPHSSEDQYSTTKAAGITQANLQPGDLVFYDYSNDSQAPPNHVGMVWSVSGNQVIQAGGNNPNQVNIYSPIAETTIVGYGRPSGVGSTNFNGNASGNTNTKQTAASSTVGFGNMGYLGEGNAPSESSILSGALLPKFGTGDNINGGNQGSNNGSSNAANNNGSSAGAPVTDANHLQLIQQSLKLAGIPDTPANENAVNIIVTHESSWNAASVNNSDSNAAEGHPSQGLMQTIASTFQAYAIPGYNTNILDPLSNLIAGERYAVARYGSLTQVPGVASVNSGGGYSGYEAGTQYIESETLSQLHPGEMVVPSEYASMERMGQMSGNFKTTIRLPANCVYHDTLNASSQDDIDKLVDSIFDAVAGAVS